MCMVGVRMPKPNGRAFVAPSHEMMAEFNSASRLVLSGSALVAGRVSRKVLAKAIKWLSCSPFRSLATTPLAHCSMNWSSRLVESISTSEGLLLMPLNFCAPTTTDRLATHPLFHNRQTSERQAYSRHSLANHRPENHNRAHNVA